MKMCISPGCFLRVMAKGMCQKHYDADRHRRRYIKKRSVVKPTCSHPECAAAVKAKGLCSYHYHASLYIANKERFAARNKAWRSKNMDKVRAVDRKRILANHDAYLARRKAWKAKNAERVRMQNKEWCDSHRDISSKRSREWKRRNPENGRKHCDARRARLAGAIGTHTEEDIVRLYRKQQGKCAICRNDLPKKHCRDHIIPLSRGGANDITNIQLVCWGCNSSKRDKDPITFMQHRGFLL